MYKKIISIILITVIVISSISMLNVSAIDNGPVSKTYRYADLVQDVEVNLAQYGDIVKWSVAGYSVEGRKIYAIEVGKGPEHVLITGGMQGNETANTPMIMDNIIELLASYTVPNAAIRNFMGIYTTLTNEVTIVFMPLINPDSYEYCMANNDATKYTNSNGINLYTDFSFSNANIATQPETLAVVNTINKYDYACAVNYYSKGRTLNPVLTNLNDSEILNCMPVATLNERTIFLKDCAYEHSLNYAPLNNVSDGTAKTLENYLYKRGTPTLYIKTMQNSTSPIPTQQEIMSEYRHFIFKTSFLLRISTNMHYLVQGDNRTINYYVDGSLYKTYTIRHGKRFEAPPVPDVHNAADIKWSVDLDGTQITQNWDIELTYNIVAHDVVYMSLEDEVYVESVPIGECISFIPDVPIRPGYDVNPSYWSTDLTDVPINQDYVVTAQYQPNTYLVRFYGTDIAWMIWYGWQYISFHRSFPEVSKDGYRFLGWYKSENFLLEEKVLITDFMDTMSSITLYPRFVDENEPIFKIGDVDRDGKITSFDASSILRYLVKLNVCDDEQLTLADVNGDRVVDSNDASKILRHLVKIDIIT